MQLVLARLASHKHKESNMGQFKPMVKMMTTEPSVELKLAKGGAVKMKKGGMAEGGHKKMAGGGSAMEMMMGTPALVGRPTVNAPVRAPGKPSMAMRRKAMMAKQPMMPSAEAMPPMKKGGKAEGGDTAQDKAMIKKAFKQHDMQEHKGDKGTDLKLKKGGMKKGGMATGGVKMGNAGGFKHGGKTSKKAYATGGTVDSGKPVAMPQGAKKPSQPVSTNRQAGTFKKGGKVMMNGGGTTSGQGAITDRERKTAQDLSKGAYDKTGKYNRELEDAMNPLSMVKELYGKARDAFSGQGSVNDVERNAMQRLMEDGKKDPSGSVSLRPLEDARRKMGRGQGAITETERSVTVSPTEKRRGGRAC